VFVLVPIPADPSLDAAGGARRPGDRADRGLDGQPDLAERIMVRRTVGPADFESDLNSWKGSSLGPAHTLKQSAFFRGSNAAASASPGCYYAGSSSIPGIGLPMCLISAELVLKRLRGDTSTEALPEPVLPIAPEHP
jgi:phytoene dehydrogenase-like protein